MGFQDGGGGFGGRPREMHKAVCAECKKECEVPFKPSTDRPIYCKEVSQSVKTPAVKSQRLKKIAVV